jgi:two-component system NtrC family response regulator
MPERILMVDDEPDIVAFCSKVPVRLGDEVTGSDSSQEALQALSREHYDLLITDVMMPGISGLELVAQARRQQPGLEAIVITGLGAMETPPGATRLGGCDLVSKPFGVPDLHEAIERALDRVRQRRARGHPATPSAPAQQHSG